MRKQHSKTSSPRITGHVEALRAFLELKIRFCKPLAKGAIKRFLVTREVRCDSSVRISFQNRYGCAPYDYYIERLAAQVREIRARRPLIANCWIVLRTGAAEVDVNKAIDMLNAERAA